MSITMTMEWSEEDLMSLAGDMVEEIALNISETFGHAEYARSQGLEPVTRLTVDQVLLLMKNEPSMATAWRMQEPGHSRKEAMLHYLGNRDRALIHLGGYDAHRYDAEKPLIEELLGPTVTSRRNWGRFLTEVGYKLNAGEDPREIRAETEGSGENVYRWKSPANATPFRTVTRQQLEEHPAMWWSHPTFERIEVSVEQSGHTLDLDHQIAAVLGEY